MALPTLLDKACKNAAAGVDTTLDAQKTLPLGHLSALLNTATETAIYTGACRLHRVTVLVADAHTIAIYDGTAATGTLIVTLPASATALIPLIDSEAGITFSTSLTFKCADAVSIFIEYSMES